MSTGMMYHGNLIQEAEELVYNLCRLHAFFAVADLHFHPKEEEFSTG